MNTRQLAISVAVIATLFAPSVLNPISADTGIGPIPIPANLIPPIVPGTSTTIFPTVPNLGSVKLAIPLVYTIKQTSSGLVASDSLTNEVKTQQELQANPGYWKYFGDAPAENATYDFYKDSQGLHIGVQAPVDGTYAGYYAESPNHAAYLWHAKLTTPVSTISNTTDPQWFQNGLYVQRSTLPVNYVSCFSTTGAWGTEWVLGSVTGDANQATQFNILWTDTSANQPLTRDCTIVTNGQNMLKAYIDGNLVYSNSTMNLQMPSPFNAYLEPQSSYADQLLNGIYQDYYVTTDENIKVTNNPPLASYVDVVVPSSSGNGTVVATAPVDSSGTATLDIGALDMPLNAYIKVYGTAGIQLASTPTTVNIFGGDSYSVKLLGGLLG